MSIVSFLQDEVLKRDHNDGCKTIHSKMVRIVNFFMYIFTTPFRITALSWQRGLHNSVKP